jgi:hypothetical protein
MLIKTSSKNFFGRFRATQAHTHPPRMRASLLGQFILAATGAVAQ